MLLRMLMLLLACYAMPPRVDAAFAVSSAA